MIILKLIWWWNWNVATDTDNHVYKIKSESVYEDLHKFKELFDFSNYQNDSKYYSGANNLVVGKMKDETSSLRI